MAGTNRYASSVVNKVVRQPSAGTTPRIINGDTVNFTTPPAKVEDSAFPMSNLLNSSRYTPWATPINATVGNAQSGTTLAVHIDTGTITVNVFGLMGLRYFLGATNPNLVAVSHRTDGAGYLSSGFVSGGAGADFTLTFNGQPRDANYVISSPITGRYWEILFQTFDVKGFSLGNIFLGNMVDTGILYSPGAQITNVARTIKSRSGSGSLDIVKVGDEGQLVSLPYRNIDDSKKAIIDAEFGTFAPKDHGYWLNSADSLKQVALNSDGLAWVHQWAAPNLWDLDLEIEVLG